jgi:hypothetical protein
MSLNGHSDYVNFIAFSSNGQFILTSSSDHTVRVWDSTTGVELHTLEGHSETVNSAAFSPKGEFITSGSSDGTVRVWDAQTGSQLHILEGHSDWVFSVAFSPDGSHIISRSQEHTLVWDAVTGLPSTLDKVDFAPLRPAIFRPIFKIDQDGWMWRLDTKERLQRMCWLPVERRGGVRSHGQKVCVAAESGVTTILDFSNVSSP